MICHRGGRLAPRRRTAADLHTRKAGRLACVQQPAPVGIPARILVAMQPGRTYSRAELLAATDIRESDWTWAIRQFKENGLVVQVGEKRGGRYQRT